MLSGDLLDLPSGMYGQSSIRTDYANDRVYREIVRAEGRHIVADDLVPVADFSFFALIIVVPKLSIRLPKKQRL